MGIEAARRAVVEAEDPVRLAGHRVLADMFVPRQVAALDRVAEGMAESRLPRLGIAVLTAEIGAAVIARTVVLVHDAPPSREELGRASGRHRGGKAGEISGG